MGAGIWESESIIEPPEVLHVTQAVTNKAGLAIEATSVPEQFDIKDLEANTKVGSLTLSADSAVTVDAFKGKGGTAAIVSSKTTGVKYFVLPGGELSIGNVKVAMDGAAIPQQKAVSAKPVAKANATDDSLQTMILGAGLATRFEPVSGNNTDYSKPAVPLLGDTSVIQAIADNLFRSGYTRLFVNTYFKPESLKAGLNKTEQAKASKLAYIDEAAPSGTAGALRQLLESPEKFGFDPSKPTLVVQGDAVTDVDFSQLYQAHLKSKALVTIGCMEVPENQVDQFGIIVTDKAEGISGRIQFFQEKPKQGEHKSTLANTGFYIFSPEAYPIILSVYKAMGEAGKQELDFAKNIFPKVLEQASAEHPFWSQQVQGYWNDIGNSRQYLETMHDVAAGKVALPLPADVSTYFDKGVLYWPGTKAKAEQESAQLTGNVIVALPYGVKS